MSCSKAIKSTWLNGYNSGGTLTLVGYAVSASGTPGAGGNWPWSSNTDPDPIVNFNNIESGYYTMRHSGGGASGEPCYGEVEFIIPVTHGGSAGVDSTSQLCDNQAPITPGDILGAVFDGSAAVPPTFGWSGDGTASPGWSAGAGNHPDDATFDPTLAGIGTYTLVLTITPGSAAGYTKEASCSNCDETTATLTVIVTEQFNAGTAQTKAACNDGEI